jgi:hypothetical protein
MLFTGFSTKGGILDLLEIRHLAVSELRRVAEFGDGYTAHDLAEIIDRPAAGVYATLAGLVRSGLVRLGADGVYSAAVAKVKRPEALSVKPELADFTTVAPTLPSGPTRSVCSISPDVRAALTAIGKAEASAARAAELSAAWTLHVQGLRAYLAAIGGNP